MPNAFSYAYAAEGPDPARYIDYTGALGCPRSGRKAWITRIGPRTLTAKPSAANVAVRVLSAQARLRRARS